LLQRRSLSPLELLACTALKKVDLIRCRRHGADQMLGHQEMGQLLECIPFPGTYDIFGNADNIKPYLSSSQPTFLVRCSWCRIAD